MVGRRLENTAGLFHAGGDRERLAAIDDDVEVGSEVAGGDDEPEGDGGERAQLDPERQAFELASGGGRRLVSADRVR